MCFCLCVALRRNAALLHLLGLRSSVRNCIHSLQGMQGSVGLCVLWGFRCSGVLGSARYGATSTPSI